MRTTMRTLVKRVRGAIAGDDKGAAETALKDATRYIDKAVAKGLCHRKTGSRYISRLSAQVSGIK